MTELGDLLIARIARTGPLSLAEYMADCLMHPQHGYYATRDPFGAAGDFTTAPEISQMFGELIGLALAQTWMDQGFPAPITLAELGPGRGTLMSDMLRATRGVPGFHDALSVHLVETSPALRRSQAALIPDVIWHENVDTLPQAPLFVVANEFFDALPIRQFLRDGDGWREKVVALCDGVLGFGLSEAAPIAPLQDRLTDTRDGDLVEHCPALPAIAAALSARIEAFGGCAIIIDYGDWASLGDTLQALRSHRHTDPLAVPGQTDLTAHVDFAAIAKHARPAKFSRLTPQGVFLERLGIAQRAQVLAGGLSGEALKSHLAAYRRLTHRSEMGELFKVIGIYPSNAAAPPGLEP